MSDLTKKQAWGVIDALPDPHASLLENYIEQLEANCQHARAMAELLRDLHDPDREFSWEIWPLPKGSSDDR